MTHFMKDELVLDSTHHTHTTPYMAQNDPRWRHVNSTEHNEHNGQRKLLLSEVEFLTEVHLSRFYQNGVDHGTTPPLPQLLCVYAGGCPGEHLDDILMMFPNVFFVIVDPRFSDTHYKKYQNRWSKKRVAVCANHFDDGTAVAIAGWVSGRKDIDHWVHKKLNVLDIKQVGYDDLFFISDIRSNAYDERAIARDMQAQSRWFKQLNASAGLLKFRLPFCTPEWFKRTKTTHGVYSYLDGVVFLPIYGPPSTTECRLYVRRGCKEKFYNPYIHECRMAEFETHDRQEHYSDGFQKFSSFDQVAEASVIHKYQYLMGKYGYDAHIQLKYSQLSDIHKGEQNYMIYLLHKPSHW